MFVTYLGGFTPMTTIQAIGRPAVALVVLLGGRACQLKAAEPVKKASPSTDNAPVLPKADEIRKLTVFPTAIQLKGRDDARQLIVTGALKDDRVQDLSSDVT